MATGLGRILYISHQNSKHREEIVECSSPKRAASAQTHTRPETKAHQSKEQTPAYVTVRFQSGGGCPPASGRGRPTGHKTEGPEATAFRRGDPRSQQTEFSKVHLRQQSGNCKLNPRRVALFSCWLHIRVRGGPPFNAFASVEVPRGPGSEDRVAVQLFFPENSPCPRPIATPPKQVVLPDLLFHLPLVCEEHPHVSLIT